MPIHMLAETAKALKSDAALCTSRSLFNDRFSDPGAKDEPRKAWFSALIKKAATPINRATWHPPTANLLHARLMGRLMVNLGGGTMTNANLLVDRYGLPVIPGSAVKGCARRMALQLLYDHVCEAKPAPEDMLASIAKVFGWVQTDWSGDLAWACHNSQDIITAAKAQLPKSDSFSGTIAFLPAHPDADPGLELDVLTPHHKKYYERKQPTATDDEDPVPVYFPTVKAQTDGHYFTFPLIPLRGASSESLYLARAWLSQGLGIFGLGAKTNAGYGWFDASDELNQSVVDAKQSMLEAQVAARLKQAEEARIALETEERRKAKEARAAMTPDELIADLTDSQFDAKIRAFWKEPKKGGPTETERPAIITALKTTRIAYWQEFKVKSAKGGDLGKSEQAIRSLNKQLHGDKMP
jgi:CRISPR type III-B/RAMP module RAMP protein Cmr6